MDEDQVKFDNKSYAIELAMALISDNTNGSVNDIKSLMGAVKYAYKALNNIDTDKEDV